MQIFRLPSYQFRNGDLLEQALTHRSFASSNNERLELLGDAILDMVITRYLFDAFPEASEGQLSQMRANLVKKDTLARIAREFRVGEYLKLGSGELKTGAHRRASILADAVEALIAAAYIDSDYQLYPAEKLVLSLYHNELQGLSPEQSQKDDKTLLQEWLQARGRDLPEYRVLDSAGKDHQKTFTVECRLRGVGQTFAATAGSKRKAEQLAAKSALEFVQV